MSDPYSPGQFAVSNLVEATPPGVPELSEDEKTV
jgi:hypothetical protein